MSLYNGIELTDETLESKYKYMCKLCEQMASSLHKASKVIEDNEKMKDYIDNMCGMIEAETPLKEHDRWLEDCIELGYYKSEVENETK